MSERQYERSDAVALLVREELARRRLSRQWLADTAKISLSTLEKALSGQRPFTLATIVRLEEALDTRLRADGMPSVEWTPTETGLAPEDMGAYARQGVRWLEGEYLTLRPSFSEPDAIYAYRTLISWDEARSHLVFSEGARVDRAYEQKGFVSFPHLSGHIYLVTIFEGQYRMALLNRPYGAEGALNGVLTTLVAGDGAQLIPAAVPIALLPTSRRSDAECGLIRPGDQCHEEYRAHVDKITRSRFALFPM